MNERRSGWSGGFLWGCLTPLILVGALFAAGLIYAGYYMHSGFKHDAALETVVAAVKNNAVAQAVLGRNISLQGAPSYNVHYLNGTESARYRFAVRGPNGTGVVGADVTVMKDKTTIRSLRLRGPSGRIYDLLHDRPPRGTTTSI